MSIQNQKKGFGLVEVLVGIFIFSIILGALVVANNMYLSGAGDNLKSAKAAYLAEEGIEVVKTLRDIAWINISGLSTSTDYYLTFNNNTSLWATTTTVTATDSYFRKVRLTSVSRDANGKIVTSGGTVDTKTKQVTVSVSWLSKNATTTKSLSTYITNVIGS